MNDKSLVPNFKPIKLRVYQSDNQGYNSLEILSQSFKVVEEIDDALFNFVVKGDSEIVNLNDVLKYAVNPQILKSKVKSLAYEIDDRTPEEKAQYILLRDRLND